jgi:hypothetical protein
MTYGVVKVMSGKRPTAIPSKSVRPWWKEGERERERERGRERERERERNFAKKT